MSKLAKQEITLQELNAVKKSVAGRLSRLHETPCRYDQSRKSPIAKIDAFSQGIDEMENILKEMQNRIDNVKITIEL
jgi:hypothetical protein